jgi:hypothetical protein
MHHLWAGRQVSARGDTDHSIRNISTLLHILTQMQAPSFINAIAFRGPQPPLPHSSPLTYIVPGSSKDRLCHCMQSPLYKTCAQRLSDLELSLSSVSRESGADHILTI